MKIKQKSGLVLMGLYSFLFISGCQSEGVMEEYIYNRKVKANTEFLSEKKDYEDRDIVVRTWGDTRTHVASERYQHPSPEAAAIIENVIGNLGCDITGNLHDKNESPETTVKQVTKFYKKGGQKTFFRGSDAIGIGQNLKKLFLEMNSSQSVFVKYEGYYVTFYVSENKLYVIFRLAEGDPRTFSAANKEMVFDLKKPAKK